MESTSDSAFGLLSGCTIIARNYLAQARALAQSFLQHEPEGRFYVLVVDGLPDGVKVDPRVHVLGPRDLEIPDFLDMCFRYDVTELCTAVKPTFLSVLLERFHERRVAYFDPDILIFRPLAALHEALTLADIVLIPHLLDPIPLDGKKPSEQDILIAGAYNLGFIAVKESDESRRFLRWWEERLASACVVDPGRGLFVDQKWVDLVPSMFGAVAVLRDPTYDVAYWNLHSRTLVRREDGFYVGDAPLTFFHFSGFNPRLRRTLSKHQTRIEVIDDTALSEILDMYADLLERLGHRNSSKWGYGYGAFNNGVRINPIFRRLYTDAPVELRKSLSDPFSVTAKGGLSFLSWATRADSEYQLSPFLEYVYRSRPDVVAAYPDVRGVHREAFIRWAVEDGSREMGFDRRLALDGGALDDAYATTDNPGVTGVNVCGYLRNETGIGAIARGYVAALQSAGVPTSLSDVSPLSPNRSEDPTLAVFDRDHPFDVNLICVNADQHFEIASHIGEEFFRDRYNIAVWFWELPSFPAAWHDRFAHYDEIWAASSFIAGTLAQVSPIPVVRMPPVLAHATHGSRLVGRRRLGVHEDEFVFLFVFDFRSQFERKNPLGLIHAFRTAFLPSDPVRLVIKCVNEDSSPSRFEEMRQASVGYPISIQTGYIAAREMRDLFASSDAYISLHRSEGLGLTMAEAMSLGKPVIATAWSGNTDFMNVGNSFLVPYTLVELSEDAGPYRAGEVWAEPSLDDAAHLMQSVYSNREEAFGRGAAAKQDIETHFSVDRVGKRISERLQLISRRVADRSAATGARAISTEPSVAGAQTLISRAPAVPPMDLEHSIYGPLGLAAKKGMHFLLSYHTLYQQQVDASFANFMRELAVATDRQSEQLRELVQRVQRTEKVVGRMASSASALDQRLRHVDEIRKSFDDSLADLVNRMESLSDAVDNQVARVKVLNDAVDAQEDRVRDVSSLSERVESQLIQLRGDLDQSLVSLGQHSNPELEGQRARLDQIAADLAEVMGRFLTRPYMAEDVYGMGHLDEPMAYTLGEGNGAGLRSFSDLFRGGEQFIAERQRVYLPFFEGLTEIVDLGCGRGEFLELLDRAGIPAIGVDLDSAMVEHCVSKGLKAVQEDALEHVCKRTSGSLDGIFSAQFIEHLPPDLLIELLDVAHDRLRTGGTFIAETVNPESYNALKTFHVDLTHQRPIYPQVLLHMCQQAGFASARIFYPVDGGFTQANYDTAGEYAVIAIK